MPELPNADSRPLGLRDSLPAGLLGFLASAWQIYLAREFSAQFHGSELTFGLVLAAWLLGGGLGGLWAGRARPRRAGFPGWLTASLLAAPAAFIALRGSRWILGDLPGEVTGFAPILGFALAAGFALNFPLGAAFVRAVEDSGGNISRTYFRESAGAAAGGLMVYLVLVPALTDWTALSALQLAGAGTLFALRRRWAPARKPDTPDSRGRRGRAKSPVRLPLLIVASALGLSLAVLDLPFQKAVWRPFQLAASRDTPYGRIQAVRVAEQITIYENGVKSFTYPDPAGSEESVHFPLLLLPRPGTVLLVGGGLGGGIGEALKHPVERVDSVEIDPRLAETVRPLLPRAAREALEDPRVRLIPADGRVFLERTSGRYDAIVVAVPEPSTAQFNRYFTAEFFRAARAKLAPGGIFTFKAGAGENYIGPGRRRYLAVLARSLRSAFPAVAVVPGENAVFLASDHALSLDPAGFADTLAKRAIPTSTLTREALYDRLQPLRLDALRAALDSPEAAINSDLKPIGYFFHSLIWSEQTGGFEGRLLGALEARPALEILGAPVLFILAVLIAAGIRRRPGARATLPLALLGLTTIAVEIVALIRFQAIYGSFYGRVAGLLTMVMAGLAAGAWTAARRVRLAPRSLAFLQAGVIGLLILGLVGASKRPPGWIFDAYLLAWGFLSGAYFVVAGRAYPPDRDKPGQGYAWDLLGSFAGAVALSAIFVPLAGLPAIIEALGLMACALFVFLLAAPGRPQA